MNSNDVSKTHFALHYELLELDDRANWDAARANYRRLVHLWHPDKFTNRPRERAHAQQHFIDLTKSYNELRDFYRKNQRLPFQSMSAAHDAEQATQPEEKFGKEFNPESQTLDSSVLSRTPSQRNQSRGKSGRTGKVIWLMLGIFVLFATVAGFLVLDRKANQAIAEKGREVVKEAPESEFMPSAADIRRSQSRGAFVKPTQ